MLPVVLSGIRLFFAIQNKQHRNNNNSNNSNSELASLFLLFISRRNRKYKSNFVVVVVFNCSPATWSTNTKDINTKKRLTLKRTRLALVSGYFISAYTFICKNSFHSAFILLFFGLEFWGKSGISELRNVNNNNLNQAQQFSFRGYTVSIVNNNYFC